jgi:hypothetical protein
MKRALAILLLLSSAGCSADVASNARYGSVAPGATAPGAPPDIEVVSPAPASWLPTPDATFEVVVRIPAQSVSIGGVPAMASQGRYTAALHLDPGLVTVTVVVTDAMGSSSAASFSYEVGPFRPFPSPVAGAALARLNPQAIPALAAAVTDELDAVDWNALIAPVNPVLAQSYLGGFVNLDIDIVNVGHGPWSATVAFQNGGIAVAAQVQAVIVDAVVTDPSGSLIPLHLAAEGHASRAAATTVATIAITASGSPTVQLSPPAVVIDNFTLTAPGALPSLVAPLVQGTLSKTLERVLSGVIERALTRTLDNHIARVAGPHPVTLNGVDFTVDALVESLVVDPTGLALTLGGDVVAVATAATSATVTAPGLPFGAPVPPTLGSAAGVVVALSPDLVAKALITLQQAGGLDLDVDASAWSGLGATLPSLDTTGLAKLLPELATLPPTPLKIRVRPKLPPELAIAPGPDLATIHLGEVLLEIATDPPGGGLAQTLLGLTVAGVIPVTPSVSGNVVTLGTGAQRPAYSFAVVEQPVLRFDARGLEIRLAIVLDALLPQLLQKVQIALPQIQASPIQNPAITAVGPNGDWLAVSGDP